MNKEEVMRELQEIFRDVFIDDSLEITENTTAKDIEEWDSLMQITLISEMEKKYNVEFSIEDVDKLKNVGDMADLIIRSVSGV